MNTEVSAKQGELRSPDETLEDVRELLFGRQVRLLEQQLQQQTSSSAERLAAAMALMDQRVASLETRCQEQFVQFTNQVVQLENQLAKQHQALLQSKAGRADLAGLFSELADRLDSPSSIVESALAS